MCLIWGQNVLSFFPPSGSDKQKIKTFTKYVLSTTSHEKRVTTGNTAYAECTLNITINKDRDVSRWSAIMWPTVTLWVTQRYKYTWDSWGLPCLPNTCSSRVCMDRRPAHTIHLLLHCLAGGGNLSLYGGWQMKTSNDDILNCDVPINRPGKVTLISVAVRDDCFLAKVTQCHHWMYFLYRMGLVS